MTTADIDREDIRDIGMRAARDKEIIEYALKHNRIVIKRRIN